MNPTHHAPITDDVPGAQAPTMTVRVPDWHANWGRSRNAPHPLVRTLTIAVVCPVCGGERGAPRPQQRCNDGDYYYCVDAWTNPCGHIDYYDAVLAEAGISIPSVPALPGERT